MREDRGNVAIHILWLQTPFSGSRTIYAFYIEKSCFFLHVLDGFLLSSSVKYSLIISMLAMTKHKILTHFL